MKKQIGVWIDSQDAIIVSFDGGKEHIEEVKGDIENAVHHHGEGDKGTQMGSHHISNEKTFEERKKHQIHNYVKSVFEQIKNADEWYIFGPAEIKHYLKKLIEEDHSALLHKLKAVESCDHLSHPQIVAKVKEFYKIH